VFARACFCRLTGLVESVEESEGLRGDGGWEHDGAWEHGVLQQRAAREAPLHEAPHVCVLMHVGAAQARTRRSEAVRPRVLAAEQVRDIHPASAYIYVYIYGYVYLCVYV
jgi:hypothetical protein